MDVHLSTDRLLLRRLTAADVDDLHALDNDPAVMEFLTGGTPVPRDTIVRETLPRLTADYGRSVVYGHWAGVERATGTFLGWFGLPRDQHRADCAELGYRLNRAAWGKGYATEGSRALIDHTFRTSDLQAVYAQTMFVNRRSRRVMEKCGLRHLRTFHETYDDPLPGTEHGEVEYGLTRAEWERLPPVRVGLRPGATPH